jgi:2-C-methyl-D-erythritol 2,4-cyclodiphosphate synthase
LKTAGFADAFESALARHAKDLAEDLGYRVLNLDSTVILERPNLKDYRQAIRERIAETLGIELDRVSVKFKTAETVGPVGEGRSAEAQAIVTLQKLGTGPFHESAGPAG